MNIFIFNFSAAEKAVAASQNAASDNTTIINTANTTKINTPKPSGPGIYICDICFFAWLLKNCLFFLFLFRNRLSKFKNQMSQR